MRMLKRIVRIGLPSGLQSAMYTTSNIIIQSSVNSLGTDTVAAWATYGKIDVIFWMIISAFSISVTTFVGQNYGAGKMDRVRKGIRVCLGMSFVTTLFLSLFLYNFGQYIFQIFTTDPAVLTIGMDVLHYLVPDVFNHDWRMRPPCAVAASLRTKPPQYSRHHFHISDDLGGHLHPVFDLFPWFQSDAEDSVTMITLKLY